MGRKIANVKCVPCSVTLHGGKLLLLVLIGSYARVDRWNRLHRDVRPVLLIVQMRVGEEADVSYTLLQKESKTHPQRSGKNGWNGVIGVSRTPCCIVREIIVRRD